MGTARNPPDSMSGVLSDTRNETTVIQESDQVGQESSLAHVLKGVVVDDSMPSKPLPRPHNSASVRMRTKRVSLRKTRSWLARTIERRNTTSPEHGISFLPKAAVNTPSDLDDELPFIPPSPINGRPRAVFQAPKTMKMGIDQVAEFWESYNKKADFEDREFVKALGASLDVLLIFAGLFSGVNTAFILESMKPLQQDQAEKTNHLLNSVILILRDTADSEQPLHADSFAPTQQAVRCNAIFFASLCCSLTAAFGAVLGKQWLNHYEREGGLKPPPERARERQRKLQGCEKWHLEGVIESLPTILQVSLYLFLIALVDFLRPMNDLVAAVVTALAMMPLMLHLTTTIIATTDSSAPFQTRLSVLLRQSIIPSAKLGLKEVIVWLSAKVHEARYGFPGRPVYSVGWHFFHGMIYAFVKDCVLHCWDHLSSAPSQFWGALSHEEPSSKSDLLNLGCVIFSMKRASTQQEMDTVVAGMRMIPVDMKVDPNDPIIASFVETLFTFLFQPIWQPLSFVMWGGPTIDFEDLLSTLCLIWVEWKYRRIPAPIGIAPGAGGLGLLKTYEERDHYRIYADDFFVSLYSELWETLSRNPLSTNSVTLSTNIILQLQDTTKVSDRSHGSLNALIKYFQSPAENTRLMIPYLDLLSIEVFQGRQAWSGLTMLLECDGVRQALISTMWIWDRSPLELDLDYQRGRLRVERLPIFKDDLKESGFDTYLRKWFQRHTRLSVVPDIGDDEVASIKIAPQVVQSYLMSLRNLIEIHSYPWSGKWFSSSSVAEHSTCLGQIIKGEIVLPDPPPHDLLAPIVETLHAKLAARFDALYCIATLWLESEQTEPPSFLGAVLELLTISEDQFDDWDRAILSTRFEHPLREHFLPNMEAAIQFLEAASHRKWLVRGMEGVVDGYKQWGGWVLGERESLPLFRRLEDLVFE